MKLKHSTNWNWFKGGRIFVAINKGTTTAAIDKGNDNAIFHTNWQVEKGVKKVGITWNYYSISTTLQFIYNTTKFYRTFFLNF